MLVALNGYPLAKRVAPRSMTTRNSAVSLAFYERKQCGNASIPSLFDKQAFAHLNFHTAPLASDGHNPIYFVELTQINRVHLLMSALGQKQTYAMQNVMSALPPIADMCIALGHVRFVPRADMAPPIRSPRRLAPAATVGLRGRAHSPRLAISCRYRPAARLRRSALQLVASFTRKLVGKTNWNSDPFLPSDEAVS